MHKDGRQQLQVDDRVKLRDSAIQASGVITGKLLPDYLRVRWGDSLGSTTHRRHSVVLECYIDTTERMISA